MTTSDEPTRLSEQSEQIIAELRGLTREEARRVTVKNRLLWANVAIAGIGLAIVTLLGINALQGRDRSDQAEAQRNQQGQALDRQAETLTEVRRLVAAIEAASSPERQARSDARLQGAIDSIRCDNRAVAQEVIDLLVAEGVIDSAESVACPSP